MSHSHDAVTPNPNMEIDQRADVVSVIVSQTCPAYCIQTWPANVDIAASIVDEVHCNFLSPSPCIALNTFTSSPLPPTALNV